MNARAREQYCGEFGENLNEGKQTYSYSMVRWVSHLRDSSWFRYVSVSQWLGQPYAVHRSIAYWWYFLLLDLLRSQLN